MPNAATFTILPIQQLISRYIVGGGKKWIDPYARNSVFNSQCFATNDLNPNFPTTHHLKARDFLALFEPESIYGVLFDPPYSAEQVKRCYESVGLSPERDDTNGHFYPRAEVARVIQPGGYCINCGWNSVGLGKKNGMEIVEILMVCHGAAHPDTIVVVDRKVQKRLF
jgi:hypothetical protein